MKERQGISGLVALLVGVGFAAAWRVGAALSDDDVRLMLGGCAVLAVVLVVGAIFVAWSMAQSRLRRQELQQDDFDELRKMAMLGKIMAGRAPNIKVEAADAPQLPGYLPWPYPTQGQQGQTPVVLDGEYRDTIDLE